MQRVFAAGCAVFLSVLAACEQRPSTAEAITEIESPMIDGACFFEETGIAYHEPEALDAFKSGARSCVSPTSGCPIWWDATVQLNLAPNGVDRELRVTAVYPHMYFRDRPGPGPVQKTAAKTGASIAELAPALEALAHEAVGGPKQVSEMCVRLEADRRLSVSDVVALRAAVKAPRLRHVEFLVPGEPSPPFSDEAKQPGFK